MHKLFTASAIYQRAAIAGTVFFLTFISLPAYSMDWPGWRGPEGNGISGETTIRPNAFDDGLDIVWNTNVGIGYSSVAVADGAVYTLGNRSNVDTVYALDARTGQEIWSYSYPCPLGGYPGPRATPLVDNGRVYTLSREGHIFCFDAENGAVIWEKHMADDFRMSSPQWGFAGSPVSFRDLILFNAGQSGIALKKSDGNVAWSSKRGRGSYAAPVLYPYSGGTAAAIFAERAVLGVDAATGKLLWSHSWPTNPEVNAADPVVSDGHVFVASAYGIGSALINFTGKTTTEVWSSSIFNTHFSSFVLIDGKIYGNDGDARRATSGTFRCIDLMTGEVKWSERAGFGSIIAVGPYLVTLDYKGLVSLVRTDPNAYRLIGSGALPRGQFWTPPAFSNGHLYCRDIKGNLYKVDLR